MEGEEEGEERGGEGNGREGQKVKEKGKESEGKEEWDGTGGEKREENMREREVSKFSLMKGLFTLFSELYSSGF